MVSKIGLVGDVNLQEYGSADGTIVRILGECSLKTANLEQPLSRRGAPEEKQSALRGDPGLARWLVDHQFDVVNLANNHSNDFGKEALLDTFAALEKHDIEWVGAGRCLQESKMPVILRDPCNDLTAGFVGFSCTLPPGSTAAGQRAGIAPIRIRQSLWTDPILAAEQPGTPPYVRTWAEPEDVEAACDSVAELSERVDVVAVHIHWGVPPTYMAPCQGWLCEYQRPLGQALVDAGAQMVLGHHPHVAHGIERYKDGVILYSLSNFIFHSLDPSAQVVRRPTLPFQKTRVEEYWQGWYSVAEVEPGKVREMSLYPITLDSSGNPQTAPVDTAMSILKKTDSLSQDVDGSVEVVDSPCGPIGKLT